MKGVTAEGERGSGTVITLALIGALLAIGAALAVAAGELTAKSYGQGVADISALAAARVGTCTAAPQVRAHNPGRGLELARCDVREGSAPGGAVRNQGSVAGRPAVVKDAERSSNTRRASSLSRGLLPFPHLGD